MSKFRRNTRTKNNKLLNDIQDITDDIILNENINNEQSLILQNHASHINDIQGKIDLVMTLENRVKVLEDIIVQLINANIT